MVQVIQPLSSLDAANRAAAGPLVEFKAGGTDVFDRVQQRVLAPESLVNISRLPLRSMEDQGGFLRVGALTSLDDLVQSPVVARDFPVLRQAAEHTATPQIRVMATLGGALCQRPRCVYLRHPDFHCRKKGGATCYAKHGDNHASSIFEQEACCAVHPSTVGAALLALDAVLDVRMPGANALEEWTMQRFFTVNRLDAATENALPHGALIEAVRIPKPAGATLQAYERASPRLLADWAEVEVAVVLALEGGRIKDARVVLGAVARVPRRAPDAEKALVGLVPGPDAFRAAGLVSTQGATPLEFNTYKLPLTQGTVTAALERSMA